MPGTLDAGGVAVVGAAVDDGATVLGVTGAVAGVPDDPSMVVATVDYGGVVNAAFRSGSVFAVQFHPEKSASAGLALLANFVDGLRPSMVPA